MTAVAAATAPAARAVRALRHPSLKRLIALGALGVTLSLCVTVAAMFVVNARWSTETEIGSAFALAATYLDARRERITSARDPMAEAALLTAELDALRHVSATLQTFDGDAVTVSGDARPAGGAPGWFRALIEAPGERLEHPVIRYPNRLGVIVLESNPADEIEEVWGDFRVVMPAILGAGAAALTLAFLTILAVMRRIDAVGGALRAMRSGALDARAPEQRFAELAALADDANALAAHLAEQKRENRRLLRRMMSLSEDERRALAGDLHDGLGPSLFALRAALRSAAEPGVQETARLQAIVAATRHADAVQATCRAAIDTLRPMLLGEASLRELLEDFAASFLAIAPETAVTVSVDAALPESLGELGDLCVYRFAQESTLNAVRHGHARRVTIMLRRETGPAGAALSASVRDDGAGPGSGAPPRHGQVGMADRARALDGFYEPPGSRDGAVVTTLRLPI